MKNILLITVLIFLGIKDPCLAQNCAASFTWTQTGPNVISFTSTSTGTTSNTNYMWSFGDSQYGYSQNEIHTYLNPGYYYVCLTIYDSSFCQSTYCDSIQVTGTTQNCTANFSYYVTGNTVTFTNTSMPNTGMGWYWSFGDAGTDNTMNPVHTYSNSGWYNVCLTIWTINQTPPCSDTICMQIYVGSQQSCNANFTYVVNGNVVTFTNTSTGGNFPFYTWSFGDAGTSTVVNPMHTYTNPGTYWVCLTMQDSTCLDSVCQYVTIGSSGFGEEAAAIHSISLFPNPCLETTSILLELDRSTSISMIITDLTGRSIHFSKEVELSAGTHTLQLNTSNLNSGTYLVRFSTGEGSITKRLSVMH